MKTHRLFILLACAATLSLQAQDKAKQWDLAGCISYALTNNIQIQKAKVTLATNEVSTQQAKAQLLPGLSASVGENLSVYPKPGTTTYTGSYSLNSSLLLFDGGKTSKNVEQMKLQESAANFSILESEKNIQMSILQTYAKILYANEAVKVYEETVKTSEYQVSRGQAMLKAGSISASDLAQLESQLSSDKYQLVVAQNSLSTAQLQMRQLLELNPEQEMQVSTPQLDKTDVLQPMSSLQSVYETALKVMPQIKSGKISTQVASIETERAKAGYLPKVTLNASAGTGHSSSNSYGLGTQLSDNLNAGVGLAVSIPILSNRENKSAVEKARLSQKTAQLELTNTEKTLLSEIQTVYQEALSAQSQYYAGNEKVKALETSYELIEKQYNLGIKNTLELLTEKNNLLSARQSLLQAKYTAIMDMQVLNLYQDMSINIE